MEYKIIIGSTILIIYETLLLLVHVDAEKKSSGKTIKELEKEEVRDMLKAFPLWFAMCNLLAILLVLTFNYLIPND